MKLADTQATLWEVKRHLALLDQRSGPRPGRRSVEGISYGPCVLVSRECGSGGGHLARRGAERLGWHLYDREIINEVAHSAHVREPLIASVDERVRSAWESLRLAWQHGPIARETYLYHLRQVLLSLGHHGDVVILGRGAQYVVPPSCALRVRVIAPPHIRAERVAQREGLPLAAAASRIEKVDTERAAFIRANFQRNAVSPLDYDLIINTGEVSLETAEQIILDSLSGKLHVPPAR